LKLLPDLGRFQRPTPGFFPMLDVGHQTDEEEFWARERRLADKERRTVKSPWTLAEWRELGPGLQSVVPQPRGRVEVMEIARQGVRRRATSAPRKIAA
jgi:hypothetical protein